MDGDDLELSEMDDEETAQKIIEGKIDPSKVGDTSVELPDHTGKVAEIFSVLDKESKVDVFYRIDSDMKISEICENVEVSESTIYNYIKELKGSNLIEKTSKGRNSYQTTPIGKRMLSVIDRINDELDLYFSTISGSTDSSDAPQDYQKKCGVCNAISTETYMISCEDCNTYFHSRCLDKYSVEVTGDTETIAGDQCPVKH